MGPPPKAAAVTVSQGDRYSALKELDDLFKTTTIQSKKKNQDLYILLEKNLTNHLSKYF